jgi:hypothetical protein
MSDLGAECSVIHEQNFKIFGVVHDKFFETIWQEILGGVIRTIADFGHFLVASKTTTHSIIDTCVKEWVYLWVFSNFLPICLRRDLIGNE